MDISKYILSFLLKNKYCSLPGLGTFDLHKINAMINVKDINPPQYEIKFSPVGSIDDNFATYVANQENVSISNTSNNIKEFCAEVKKELNTTGKFTIVHLGDLVLQNKKIVFTQSDDLDLGVYNTPLPNQTNGNTDLKEKKIDFSYPNNKKNYRRKKLSIGKFILPLFFILLLLAGSFVAYKYFLDVQKNKSKANELDILSNNKNNVAINNSIADSLSIIDSNKTSELITTSNDTLQTPASEIINNNNVYKVAMFQSTNESIAKAKATKWITYGNKADVHFINDVYIVSISATHPLNDTTLLMDSLRLFFNPKSKPYLLK